MCLFPAHLLLEILVYTQIKLCDSLVQAFRVECLWFYGILYDFFRYCEWIFSFLFFQNHGIPGPFLVIVPLSTIGNWQREFEEWTDINAIVYHGSAQSRLNIQQYELHYKDANVSCVSICFSFQILDYQKYLFGRCQWMKLFVEVFLPLIATTYSIS